MTQTAATASGRDRIRVRVVQPSLAAFRVPLFRALAAQDGIDLHVTYATTERQNVEPDGFAATHRPMRIGRVAGHPVYWQQDQLDLATREQADVLILNWDVHYLSLVPALLRARAEGVKTILWGHGISRHDRSLRRLPRQWLAQMADALLLYSHRGADAYRTLGVPAERVFVAPNSLDQAPIQMARIDWLSRPEELNAFKHAHGLIPGPVLLFVSRLDAQRRVDLLLHAVARLRERYPQVRVVLIGAGPSEQHLRTLTSELRLEPHVRFVGPLYDEMELAPWFLSADCFAYPSYMGLSLLHALGYGLPVVTGDDRSAHGPEIDALQDGDNGVLFATARGAESMADALHRVLADSVHRARLAANAAATVRTGYTIPAMCEGFKAAIRYCASRT